MRFFKLMWQVHKWVGVVAAVFLLLVSVTGFLLLIKKSNAWIQPPTQSDRAGPPADYLPIDRVYAVAFAAGHAELRSEADVERIDFRPKQRVFKIHSRHRNLEVQVGAISGAILGVGIRRSDWIEHLHDGQLLADWFHDWGMPVVAVGLAVLSLSGVYLFCWPRYRRWQKRRAR